MSMFPEQPFDEREERYFLAEILKDSPIPPANLLRVIQAEQIRPRWTEIALPYGRSVSACQKAFDSLYSRIYQIPLQPLGPVPQPSPSSKSRKRPAVGNEPSLGPNRELQPRTPGFATINEPIESTAYPIGLAESGDQRKKKRGRPSKAEAELKAAEFAARGQPYPPPRKPKNPKPPSEVKSTMGSSITFTPVTMGPSGAEGASSGKKRGPKTKAVRDDTSSGLEIIDRPFQPVQGGSESNIGTFDPVAQAPQSSSSEAVLASIHHPAHDQTRKAQNPGETRQYQPPAMTQPEGSLTHREATSEHRDEAIDDTQQTSGRAHQHSAAGQVSPKPTHSTE
ncbi:MAG: hypothetical protein Q9181_000062 [Wetmoreana brouardii]